MSINQQFNQSINKSINQQVNQSVNQKYDPYLILNIFIHRGRESCLPFGSQLLRYDEMPFDPKSESRVRICDERSEQGSGGLRSGCFGKGHVRQDVQVAGGQSQQNPGHEAEETVLHRCFGYCRL